MRVKIGSIWNGINEGFNNEEPIMVVLSDKDKENIMNMHPDARRYAIFPDDCEMTSEEKMAWME